MTYTAWSADGLVITFDGLPPAHRIYDDEQKTAGPHPAGGAEHMGTSLPASSAPTLSARTSLVGPTAGASKAASPSFSGAE